MEKTIVKIILVTFFIITNTDVFSKEMCKNYRQEGFLTYEECNKRERKLNQFIYKVTNSLNEKNFSELKDLINPKLVYLNEYDKLEIDLKDDKINALDKISLKRKKEIIHVLKQGEKIFGRDGDSIYVRYKYKKNEEDRPLPSIDLYWEESKNDWILGSIHYITD